MPLRIQRKRTPGYRTPLCTCGCGKPAIYVGRGSKWGNPYKVGASIGVTQYREGQEHYFREIEVTAALAVALHRELMDAASPDFAELRGHDLSCWCPPDQACHADVLIELASGGEQP